MKACSTPALARLLHNHVGTGYPFDPGLDSALHGFVQDWQDPETGCWGQWMVDRRGKVWKMDDMAMTFHVVSDFKGKVDHLDLIAKRILQLDEINFPAGIKFDGDYSNHLNWDVVKIFPNRSGIGRAKIIRARKKCMSS
jgi:hypothetical protein